MLQALDVISFAASCGLFFAIRRWTATGEKFWIVALLILCAPGWAHQGGLF